MLLTRHRFITHPDTPSSYSGQRFLVPRVDSAEGAVEFVNERVGPQVAIEGPGYWGLPGWFWNNTLSQTHVGFLRVYIPIFVQRRKTFTQIGVNVGTAQAGRFARLGIYAATFLATGQIRPGALTIDAGTVDVGTAGQKSIAISEQLDPGFHVVCYSTDGFSVSFFGPDPAQAVSCPVTAYAITVSADHAPLTASPTDVSGIEAFPDPATAPNQELTVGQAMMQLGES